MNDLFGAFVRLLLRIVLLATGLVVAAGLAVMGLILVAGWGVYAGVARLTGRPVVPFAMGVDPREGFSRFFRQGRGAAPESSRTPRADANRGPAPRKLGVTDVDARE
jgi:hypothetical protein